MERNRGQPPPGNHHHSLPRSPETLHQLSFVLSALTLPISGSTLTSILVGLLRALFSITDRDTSAALLEFLSEHGWQGGATGEFSGELTAGGREALREVVLRLLRPTYNNNNPPYTKEGSPTSDIDPNPLPCGNIGDRSTICFVAAFDQHLEVRMREEAELHAIFKLSGRTWQSIPWPTFASFRSAWFEPAAVTMLHFAGHGTPQGPALNDGANVPLETFQLFFKHKTPSLLFLNCCYSGDAARALREVPIRFGWDGVVSDEEAAKFSCCFYAMVFTYRNILKAYQLAKKTCGVAPRICISGPPVIADVQVAFDLDRKRFIGYNNPVPIMDISDGPCTYVLWRLVNLGNCEPGKWVAQVKVVVVDTVNLLSVDGWLWRPVSLRLNRGGNKAFLGFRLACDVPEERWRKPIDDIAFVIGGKNEPPDGDKAHWIRCSPDIYLGRAGYVWFRRLEEISEENILAETQFLCP